MLQIARLAALIVFAAASAEAQQLAGTFDQLRVLAKAGDTLTVTDGSGQRVRGKLTTLSTDSLVLNVAGTPRAFQTIDVDTIEKRGSDSLKNGALIGMAIGGGLAGLAIAATSDAEPGLFLVGSLIYAGIGAGIGAGVDALVEGPRVIYARSGSARTTLTIAPVLTGRSKGVVVSLRLTR